VHFVAVHAPAPEERQERGMQVDHGHARESHEEDRREDVVEARQHHELGADAGDRDGHGRVGCRAVRVRAKREHGARHAGKRGSLQRGHAGVIRHDDRHTRIEIA